MTKRRAQVYFWVLLAVAFLSKIAFGQTAPRTYTAQAVTVLNTATTAVHNNLADATTFQCYVRPSSTAQVFTITFPDGTTVEVPSGQSLTVRSEKKIQAGALIFSAQTATSSVVLQVLIFKEQ